MCDPTRQADRLMDIRLRYTINTHLEDLGVTTPAAIGAVASLPAAEVVSLLIRRQWRAPVTWPPCRPWPHGSGCMSCRRTPTSCGKRRGPIKKLGGAVGPALAPAMRLPLPIAPVTAARPVLPLTLQRRLLQTLLELP